MQSIAIQLSRELKVLTLTVQSAKEISPESLKIDSLPTQFDRNPVCLSFAHHIYLVCGWSNVFGKILHSYWLDARVCVRFHGTVIGQPLMLCCLLFEFIFDVKLSTVYHAFDLKHNKRNTELHEHEHIKNSLCAYQTTMSNVTNSVRCDDTDVAYSPLHTRRKGRVSRPAV